MGFVLYFKIATSFIIALLGATIFARLAAVEPITLANLLPFLIATTFIVAGLWRAKIYLTALRGAGKS